MPPSWYFLLLGPVFVSAFGLLETVTFAQTGAQAFIDGQAETGNILPWQHLVYYSYVTLTTLGYGDILPVTIWARSLVSFEAIISVLYVTIIWRSWSVCTPRQIRLTHSSSPAINANDQENGCNHRRYPSRRGHNRGVALLNAYASKCPDQDGRIGNITSGETNQTTYGRRDRKHDHCPRLGTDAPTTPIPISKQSRDISDRGYCDPAKINAKRKVDKPAHARRDLGSADIQAQVNDDEACQ